MSISNSRILNLLFLWQRRYPAANKSSAAARRPGVTEEQLDEIKEAFNLFDTDHSGNNSNLQLL
jgi:hypothetical protein